MRAAYAVVLVVAILAAQLPVDAGASGPITPSLSGPGNVAASRAWGYGGQLKINGGPNAPLFNVNVTFYLNNVPVAYDATDAMGVYAAQVFIPLGTHTLETRIFEGTPHEGRSTPLTITTYPTLPGAPGGQFSHPGFWWNEVNFTWSHPWTDGGYPVTSYTVERSTTGASGPWSVVYTGLTRNLTDPNTVPNQSYWYRAIAHTSYGTGNASNAFRVNTHPVIATVGALGFRICEEANCTDVPNAGSRVVNASVNVSVIPWVGGVADHYPIAAPGVPAVQVIGRIEFPLTARNFTRTSTADGTWQGNITDFYQTAPVSGCESFSSRMLAKHANIGFTEAFGSFSLCV